MWDTVIELERQKKYFINLELFLQQESIYKTVLPPISMRLKALELTPLDQVKVVIIGQDPYHNVGQANGLAFAVNKGVSIPPSLRNIYKELQLDLGITPPNHGDLTKWAKEGVLLLNTILTVVENTPLSHVGHGWEQFTKKIIQICDQDPRPKVFVLWGNYAKTFKHLIQNENHLILESSHPSPLSARHSFFGSRPFSKINRFLVETSQSPIDFNIT